MSIFKAGDALTPRERRDLEDELGRFIEGLKRGSDNGWRPQIAEWEELLRAICATEQSELSKKVPAKK